VSTAEIEEALAILAEVLTSAAVADAARTETA
jgi:hypothetical protein